METENVIHTEKDTQQQQNYQSKGLTHPRCGSRVPQHLSIAVKRHQDQLTKESISLEACLSWWEQGGSQGTVSVPQEPRALHPDPKPAGRERPGLVWHSQ